MQLKQELNNCLYYVLQELLFVTQELCVVQMIQQTSCRVLTEHRKLTSKVSSSMQISFVYVHHQRESVNGNIVFTKQIHRTDT